MSSPFTPMRTCSIFSIFMLLSGCGESNSISEDISNEDVDIASDMTDFDHDASQHEDISPSIPLCETDRASQEIVLHIRRLAPLGRVVPGENVIVENGFNYLIINEKCEFWSWNGTGTQRIWASLSYGVLSESQRDALSDDIDIESWHTLDKTVMSESGVFDVSTWAMTYRDVSWGARCVECDAKVVQARAWIERLHAQGTSPLPSALRLIVQEIGPDELAFFNKPTTAAPAGLDLATIAHPYDVEPQECGQGVLIEDDSLIEELLTIREPYRSGQMGDFWYQFIPLKTQDGTIYKVHFREVTPFDNERGLIESDPDFGTCF